MDEYTLIIAVANTVTLLTGGAVAVLAFRAYRRTTASALRAVTIGISCIIAGSVLGGAVHVFEGSLVLGVAVQSSATAFGFAFLLYSLYTDRSETVSPSTTIIK